MARLDPEERVELERLLLKLMTEPDSPSISLRAEGDNGSVVVIPDAAVKNVAVVRPGKPLPPLLAVEEIKRLFFIVDPRPDAERNFLTLYSAGSRVPLPEPRCPGAEVIMRDRHTVGRVRAAMAVAGASREDIDAFEAEASGGTYADVLRAALRWVTIE